MSMGPAVWMKFRCELRARWVAWIGLGLLIGMVAGGVGVVATVVTEACTYVLVASVRGATRNRCGTCRVADFAERLRVVPEAPVSWGLSALVVGVSVLVAVIVAVPVARRVSSRPPANGLRNE